MGCDSGGRGGTEGGASSGVIRRPGEGDGFDESQEECSERGRWAGSTGMPRGGKRVQRGEGGQGYLRVMWTTISFLSFID